MNEPVPTWHVVLLLCIIAAVLIVLGILETPDDPPFQSLATHTRSNAP